MKLGTTAIAVGIVITGLLRRAIADSWWLQCCFRTRRVCSSVVGANRLSTSKMCFHHLMCPPVSSSAMTDPATTFLLLTGPYTTERKQPLRHCWPTDASTADLRIHPTRLDSYGRSLRLPLALTTSALEAFDWLIGCDAVKFAKARYCSSFACYSQRHQS